MMQLEAALLKYIKETYLPERFQRSGRQDFTEKDVRFFAAGAAELSEAFTSGRKEIPKNYFNRKETRSAYLLYFTLTNFSKVLKCLRECARIAPFVSQNLSILDIGCGPGTASLACSSFFADRPVSITAIDQNRDILKDANALFLKICRPDHAFLTIHEDVRPSFVSSRLKGRRFDLIIAANIVNEMGAVNDQLRFCQTLLDDHLSDGGTMIVVDPALQRTTRDLMEVRDSLNAKILAPCLHQEPCPMRAQNRRDWCHFYLEWKCPEIIRKVDRLLGIKHDYLKMAYLILKRADQKEPVPSEGSWRVVSSPLNSKGKREFVLCGNGGLERIVRLDRDRSSVNSNYDRIKRGDIISFDRGVSRISKDDPVSVDVPFNDQPRSSSTSPAMSSGS